MNAAEELAGWAVELTLDQIPAGVQRAACRHILDGAGCAVAAVAENAAPFAGALAARMPTPAESTVIGGGRAAVSAAALANGVLIHALDFDDTHAGGLVHATAAVLPTALAVGEAAGASGSQVLTAAVAGYEAVCRIAAAAPHAFHARGLHATSVCGVFASAIVASKLWGLDAEQTTNALGIAGSTAAGSLEFLNTGSATKQLHPGLAAQAGITAALLAAAGATGPASILEGEHGVYHAYLGLDVDAAAVTAGLGQTWATERITIKPYPACQLVHAPLDALRQLLPKLSDPGEIESIEFELPDDSVPIVCEPAPAKVTPRTAYEAKFSLQWSAAAMVIDGQVTVATYQSIDRDDVAALAGRVHWRVADLGSGVAAADAPGAVRVRLAGGEELEGSVPRSAGAPDSPLSDSELLAKFEGNGGTPDLADALLRLAELKSLTEIPWPTSS